MVERRPAWQLRSKVGQNDLDGYLFEDVGRCRRWMEPRYAPGLGRTIDPGDTFAIAEVTVERCPDCTLWHRDVWPCPPGLNVDEQCLALEGL